MCFVPIPRVPIQAFSQSLFPFFRDEWGNPRNDRDRKGIPLRRHGQYVTDGTVRYFSHTPWIVADNVTHLANGMYGPPIHYVKMVITPNVVVRINHYIIITS